MSRYSKEYLEHIFKYHKPDYEKAKKHELIRHRCLNLADVINEFCPSTTETEKAINHIQMAMFWANAALARHKNV